MSDGIGCVCAARSEYECCCDADWRPQELIDLQQQLASRDAEIVSLTNQRDYEYVRAENAEQERDQLRTELVKALAACKVKDEALESCGYADDSTDPEMCGPYYDAELVQQALAIQPDDAALKAFMQSKGVSYE